MKAEHIAERFGDIIDGSGGVKCLRNLVHKLAIEGRLVPHIASEVAVPLPSSDKGSPINISRVPDNWRVLRLSEVVSNRSGNSKLIKGKLHEEPAPGRFQGFSASGADIWCDDYEHEGPAIIISAVGARCGKAFKASGKWSAIANTNITWPDPVFWEFDFAYLLFNDEHFWVRGGSAQPFVKFPPSLERHFAFPPLAEQRRIVAKVDELMALCDRLEAQLKERDVKQAALAKAALAKFTEDPTPENLQLLFHPSFSIEPDDLRKLVLELAIRGKLVPQDKSDEPANSLLARIVQKSGKAKSKKGWPADTQTKQVGVFPIPENWMWSKLGEVFDVRDGTHETPSYTTSGVPLITSKNIYGGTLLLEGAKLISKEDHLHISERSKVTRGDIIFAMIGSIGNPVIVNTDIEFSIKNLALFKYHSPADSEPRFLLLYLKLVEKHMKAEAAGGVQSFVSLAYLRNYRFPLPPLSEQRRIVSRADSLFALIDNLETQLEASRTTGEKLLEAMVAELTAAHETQRPAMAKITLSRSTGASG
jgi:type I restriction enzyme S subunit